MSAYGRSAADAAYEHASQLGPVKGLKTVKERWGVRYPISGIHECPFGREQAIQVCILAQANGVDAEAVVNYGDGVWRGFYK